MSRKKGSLKPRTQARLQDVREYASAEKYGNAEVVWQFKTVYP